MQLTESCIQFLSPIVDKDGIHTTDSKLTAVKDFPTPKSMTVRFFF